MSFAEDIGDNEIYDSVKKGLNLYLDKDVIKSHVFISFLDSCFTRFISCYGRSVDLDIVSKSIASAWNLMRVKKSKDKIVTVNNISKKQKISTKDEVVTVIEVAMLDMPFLVDSIKIELSSLGHEVIEFYALAQLNFQRDANNIITNVLEDNPYSENEVYITYIVKWKGDGEYLEKIKKRISLVLNDVNSAVKDWKRMQNYLEETVASWEGLEHLNKFSKIDFCEIKEFMGWMHEFFTFLGANKYIIKKDDAGNEVLSLESEKSLGLLRKKKYNTLKSRPFLSEKASKSLNLDSDLFLFTKTNSKSTVHRYGYTDMLCVRQLDMSGKIIGETRFIGLLSSDAYDSDPTKIPLIRTKIRNIMNSQEFKSRYSDKLLRHILKNLPTDEIFQSSTYQLQKTSLGILSLQDLNRVKIFLRKDIFKSFYFALVFISKEYFNTGIRLKIEELFREYFSSSEVFSTSSFSESTLATVYFTIRIDPNANLKVNTVDLEKRVLDIVLPVKDQIKQEVFKRYGSREASRILHSYAGNLKNAYIINNSVSEIVTDIQNMELLSENYDLHISISKLDGNSGDSRKWILKLYYIDFEVSLADVFPILGDMGLTVDKEDFFAIKREGFEKDCYILQIIVVSTDINYDLTSLRINEFIKCLRSILTKSSISDVTNKLIGLVDIDFESIVLIQAYIEYCKQTKFNLSLEYVKETLVNNFKITKMILDLFNYRFMLDIEDEDFTNTVDKKNKIIINALDGVSSLSEDRVLRRMLANVMATIRTNFFDKDRKALTLKIYPRKIDGIPLPVPMYETLVFSSRFVGLHLRMSNVARGGIRWSDRGEDYRTEVLGLVEAQDLKNSVIVPSGAKGVFVPKRLDACDDMSTIFEEGLFCYKEFISNLLKISDNYLGTELVSPVSIKVYDNPDAYFVVAADKGTATFSDYANSISKEKNFWLGDAFASGGNNGYDHKKLAITAKGAWESVRWHFRSLNIDVQEDPFFVVGIGDMSGDVFGNGMLLSNKIKLVAAFDHRHIFLDPNPDMEKSFKERKRLFALRRSSWNDYNLSLVSKGGGVFSRDCKFIDLSPEIMSVLGLVVSRISPNNLIKAMLKSPVDLIWNGGIGTYIRSSSEKDLDVQDPANDMCRVAASDVKARVIGEGGNLGVTQNARVEYLLNGGLMNTDFIDNVGGVMCSDYEVNIKILLKVLLDNNKISMDKRNLLLQECSSDVIHKVLFSVYLQNFAISLAELKMDNKLEIYLRYVDNLTKKGLINPEVEKLPSRDVILNRVANSHKYYLRAEMAIILSKSKSVLVDVLKNSTLIDDKYFSKFLVNYFPKKITDIAKNLVYEHALRREIIATYVGNMCITDMGNVYIQQMTDEISSSPENSVKAYIVALQVYDLEDVTSYLHEKCDLFDRSVFLEIYDRVRSILRYGAQWLIQHVGNFAELSVTEIINIFKKNVKISCDVYLNYLSDDVVSETNSFKKVFEGKQLDEKIVNKLVMIKYYTPLLNLAYSADSVDANIKVFANLYFTLMRRYTLGWFSRQIESFPVDNLWTQIARVGFSSDIDTYQRTLSASIYLQLYSDSTTLNINKNLDCFLKEYEKEETILLDLLARLYSISQYNFAMFAVVLRKFENLVNVIISRENISNL